MIGAVVWARRCGRRRRRTSSRSRASRTRSPRPSSDTAGLTLTRLTASCCPRPSAGSAAAGLSRPCTDSAPAAHPSRGGRHTSAAILSSVLLIGHGDLIRTRHHLDRKSHYGHLDGLAAQPHLAGHAAQGVLLLLLVSESDEAVSLAKAGLVKNNLRSKVCLDSKPAYNNVVPLRI